jgi:dipeptidyl aminopeptidase/acylaminoacyl peptidase
MRLGDGFYSDIRRYDLCRDIGELGCPILIVHGSRDDVVPVENARELHKNANGPKRLEIIEGGDHSFSEPRHLEQVVNLCLGWFERYL